MEMSSLLRVEEAMLSATFRSDGDTREIQTGANFGDSDDNRATRPALWKKAEQINERERDCANVQWMESGDDEKRVPGTDR